MGSKVTSGFWEARPATPSAVNCGNWNLKSSRNDWCDLSLCLCQPPDSWPPSLIFLSLWGLLLHPETQSLSCGRQWTCLSYGLVSASSWQMA